MEQLAKMNRRTVSNYVAGLVIDSLDAIPDDVKAVVKERLLSEAKARYAFNMSDKPGASMAAGKDDYNEINRLEFQDDW